MTLAREKIPVEIWVYIFQLYCQQFRPSITWHDNGGPWLLSHVCHVWRTIALSAPALWASIYLSHFPGYDPASEEDYVALWRNSTYLDAREDRLKTQLLRSKRAPLHIRCGGPCHQEFPFLSLYSLLIDNCDRWQTVVFSCVPPSIYDIFMQQRAVWPNEKQRAPFSTLLSLELRSNRDSVHQMFKYAAPKLKSIRLSASLIPRNHVIEQLLPEAQLSHCELLDVTAPTVIPFLLQSRSTVRVLIIRELTTRVGDTDSNAWELSTDEGNRMSFPQLHKLLLDTVHPSGCDFHGFFEHIALPVLEYLNLLADRETLRSLTRALQKSGTSQPLKILELRGVEPDTTHLFPLLTMSTSLECLSITFKRHPLPVSSELDAVISLLHRHTTDSIGRVTFDNCPYLKKLEVHSARLSQPSEVDKHSLAGMVELRMQSLLAEGCVPLEAIAFGSVRGWDEDGPAECRLKTLKMNGLDIMIWHKPGHGGETVLL